jgi:hypothetical protein
MKTVTEGVEVLEHHHLSLDTDQMV